MTSNQHHLVKDHRTGLWHTLLAVRALFIDSFRDLHLRVGDEVTFEITDAECPICGAADHLAVEYDDCPSADPFAVESFNEVW